MVCGQAIERDQDTDVKGTQGEYEFNVKVRVRAHAF